ncbi:MAG: exodeoxyribonuclease VII small subunit [Dehalococcoidia bacterium]|nr:exodeoxyribonuclease VII small subunit [Dehalococcoidia bacterium]
MPRNSSKETPIEKLSFEEARGRLEETARSLEAGSLTLQDATRLYEEGVRLARRCNELLSQAELRISYLQTSYGEQMGLLKEEREEVEEDSEG